MNIACYVNVPCSNGIIRAFEVSVGLNKVPKKNDLSNH